MAGFLSTDNRKTLDTLLNVSGFDVETKNEAYILNLVNGVYQAKALNDVPYTRPTLHYDINNVNSDQTILYNIGSEQGKYDMVNSTGWEFIDGKLFTNGSTAFQTSVPKSKIYNENENTIFLVTQFMKADQVNSFTMFLTYYLTSLAIPFSLFSNQWEVFYQFGNDNFFTEESSGSWYMDEVVVWSIRQTETNVQLVASTNAGIKIIIDEPILPSFVDNDILWLGSGDGGFNRSAGYFYHLSIYPRIMSDNEFNTTLNNLSLKWISRFPSGRMIEYSLNQQLSLSVVANTPKYINFLNTPIVGEEYNFIQPTGENSYSCSMTGRYCVYMYFSGVSTGTGTGYIFLSKDGINITQPQVNTIFAGFQVNTAATRTARISTFEELQLISGSNYGIKIFFTDSGTFNGQGYFKVKYVGPMGSRSYF